MKKDFAVLADQITTALNEFADAAGKDARRNYKDARSNVDGVVSEWRDRGMAAADQAYDAAMSLEETLEDSITDRPLVAVGIAAAVGFLLGFSWRR